MPVKIKSPGGGSITLDVPNTGTDYTMVLPTTNAGIASNNNPVLTGNVAINGSSSYLSINGDNVSPYSSMRNRVINGDLKVWQRATSFTGITSSTYTADRLLLNAGNVGTGVYKVDRVTDVPSGQGFSYSANLVCTTTGTVSTGNFVSFAHNFESALVSDLAYGTSNAKTMTLSFWIKSNLTGTLPGNIAQAQNSSRVFPYYFTINAANTWQKVTITILGDTDASAASALPATNVHGFHMNIGYFQIGTQYQFGVANTWNNNGSATAWIPSGQTYINGGSSTSNYLTITGIQLEVGNVATPFEFRHLPLELMMCKRYYQKYTQPMLRGVISGNPSRMGMMLPVEMRAAPTATLSGTTMRVWDGGGTTNITSIGVAYLSTQHVEFDLNAGSTLTTGRAACLYTDGSDSLILYADY